MVEVGAHDVTSVGRVTPPPGHADDSFDRLGVTFAESHLTEEPPNTNRTGTGGGTLRVYSASADGMALVVFDRDNPDHIADRVPMHREKDGVWAGTSTHLTTGAHYALNVWGSDSPRNSFRAEELLLDPYARGIARSGSSTWRAEVIDHSFDWGGVKRPAIPLDRTVIYEAHVRGLTQQHPDIPGELRGTYAGLGHPVMTSYLNDLGVTAIELLPIHAFTTEERLGALGLPNFWGYNTLNYFSPHAPYATDLARAAGATAVANEFKEMVKSLHRAGIEVILDVVYNHTAEEGRQGPTTSFRGIDNATYYRQSDDGTYIDVTGCGNSVNTSEPVVARLILDSLRYWVHEMGVDGFRFDLAVTLGRDARHEYTPDHPLLHAIVSDPSLAGIKMIAEPWDTGLGGWQTGNFPKGWSEWNDRYRDRMRAFWLSDIAHARAHGIAPTGVGGLATRLAGSSNTFSPERGPLASVNFITAHDGFTLADLTRFDVKHNIGNGEDNRDGANENRSWNHGVEGPTDDVEVTHERQVTMRNLMGTLLLSAGIPLLTAGDESGRTQHGNNNAYCHDSPLTWVDWDWSDEQKHMHGATRELIALRRTLPALRPQEFGRAGENVPQANHMEWFNAFGATMSQEEWDTASARTLQYLAWTSPTDGVPCRILTIIHGVEHAVDVVLPVDDNVTGFEALWFSRPPDEMAIGDITRSGERIRLGGTSILLFRALSAPDIAAP